MWRSSLRAVTRLTPRSRPGRSYLMPLPGLATEIRCGEQSADRHSPRLSKSQSTRDVPRDARRLYPLVPMMVRARSDKARRSAGETFPGRQVGCRPASCIRQRALGEAPIISIPPDGPTEQRKSCAPAATCRSSWARSFTGCFVHCVCSCFFLPPFRSAFRLGTCLGAGVFS